MLFLAALIMRAAAATTDFTFRETLDVDTNNNFGYACDVDGKRILTCAFSSTLGIAAVFDSTDGLAFTETDTFQADDLQSGDGFGRHCKLEGDVAMVVSFYDNSNTGAVYAFKTDDGTTWAQKDKLLPSWASTSDRITRIAIDGFRVIVCSSFDASSGFSNSGAVAVFESADEGDSWTQTAAWTSPSPKSNGYFGNGAIFGDMLAVGAHGEDKVYMYSTTDDGATWPQRQILTATGVSAGYYGAQTYLDGTLLAVGDNGYSSERGLVAMYETADNGLTWTHEHNLIHSSPAAGDNCGVLIALHNYILASGCRRDAGDGMVVIFESTDSGTTWSETYKLSPPSGGATPAFGGWSGLGLSNGFLVVGAHGATIGANTGAVFTYGIATGAGGDPEIVDFHGHRFLAGTRPHEDLELYVSKTTVLLATTGGVRGLHNGYFLESVTVDSRGCGEKIVLRASAGLDLDVETVGGSGSCVRAQLALGDSGLALMVLDGATQTVVAIKAHVSNGFSFVNLHLMGVTDEFRDRCQSGLLCDETHGL